jgi:RepB DNA-primase from phage plasmid/Relaxase/Mobilisation nuclease domain
MIAKAVKGKGFRGALEYDLGKEQGRVLGTNMNGSDARELAAEFGEIRKLRPGLSKAVLHVSLSAAPGDHLTDDQWREIGQRYLAGMDLASNQYLITRHTDTEHEHIHLLANRIRFDGTVTSDSHDYRRHEVLMRGIERDFDLQHVHSSAEAERRAATKGEIEEGIRTGIPSTKQRLQQLCDAASKRCGSFTEYAARLDAVGVELLPVTQLDGAKLSGLSYRLDGVVMKGSDLGKRYSPAGLAKRGVTYDKERDLETVGRSIERGQAGRTGTADRDGTPGQNRERGGAGVDAGTPGAGDGRADGRNAPDAGHDRPAKPGAGRPVQEPGRDGGEGMAGRGGAGAAGGRPPEPRGPADGVAPLPPGVGNGLGDSGPRERILALAGPAHGAEPAGRASGRRLPATRDRSLEAVERQIEAMGVGRFEVLLRDAASGKTTKRQWSKAELLQNVAWLKRMNARGNDVHVRPAGEHGLVLLDGLKAENLAAMRSKGFEPAVTVETRRGHFQAWVKLSERPLPEQVRELAAAGLANALGDSPAPADRNRFGRLAGFTNHDVAPLIGVQRPYVLAHEGQGMAASGAQAYLERIGQTLKTLAKERVRNKESERQLQRDRARSRGR